MGIADFIIGRASARRWRHPSCGLRHPEVRAKRASKDGNTHGLAATLRGPRKSAGTSGRRSLFGAVCISQQVARMSACDMREPKSMRRPRISLRSSGLRSPPIPRAGVSCVRVRQHVSKALSRTLASDRPDRRLRHALAANEVRRLVGDHQRGRVEVRRDHPRHDGGIDHAQALQPVHA